MHVIDCTNMLFMFGLQEEWQMRRQAVETFITLAAAVQVARPVMLCMPKDQHMHAFMNNL